jgi:RNA polymerase sigma-70 factor (ECF subfamily)
MHDFAALYDRYFTRVYNYVRYRVGDAPSADDVVSRVFEKALDRLDSFDRERGLLDAWLFGIARNAVADHFRDRRPGASLDEAEALPDGEPRIEAGLERDESARGLLRALRLLDERQRELLALKYGARVTNRAIAAQTGLTESHVGVLLHRAVKTLQSALGKKS